MKFINLRDGIIVAVIFLSALLYIFLCNFSSGDIAEISVGGEVVKTVSLNKDDSFSVGNVSFEVRDGEIFATSSPCHDKICIKTGGIKNVGETIICLPERVSVRIVGKSESDSADIIVG